MGAGMSQYLADNHWHVGKVFGWCCMSDTGQLVCAACDTDYFALLGTKATRVIECHHQVPLASDGHGGKTNPEDMVLLCATCHRIAHTDESLLRVEGLRNSLATRSRAD